MDDPNSDASFLRVQVWGMFLQSLAFGLYVVTCYPCLKIFLTTPPRQGRPDSQWPMLVIFLVFLAKTASSLVIHLYLNLQMVAAEVTHMQAVLRFKDGSRPINIAKSAQYTTILVQAVICSGFLIYRCWLVHNRAWPSVALPLVLWLGALALMGIVIHVDTAHKISGIFDISQSKVFGSCFWGVLVMVNLITTGLIAYRIWRIAKLRGRSNFQTDTDASTSRTTKTPSHITIESGLIYTATTLVTFFLFVTKTNAVYVSIDVLVQIIGISFNLIVIHNRPRPEPSFLADLNAVPLQFVSSNMSIPGSAIEFAYPKHFMPRRKRPASVPVPEDFGSKSSLEEIRPTHSQLTIPHGMDAE
ncbi:hypothetical protein C8R46DRAFT_1249874 [Mycena filopes]|nr:hypothetical protein C8R46DRAFT_1249874 [Mycena filopes]